MTNILMAIDNKSLYSCGNLNLSFNGTLPNAVTLIIKIIQILVPVLLIIFGLIDLAKAVMAQKEDEIKKGQQTLIKRAIAAVIVFFVIIIVQMLVKFVSGSDDTIMSCFNCFINGKAGPGGCEASSDVTVSEI